MKLKFIIDECVGLQVSNWLKGKNFDVIFVGEIMAGAKDSEVISRARDEKRILITCDKDFGDIVFKEQSNHCGIILLRLRMEKAQDKIFALEKLFEKHGDQLSDNFTVVQDSNIKIIKYFFH